MDKKYENIKFFSERLETLLKKRNMSQTELAKRIDVQRANIGKYLKGETIPKLDTFFTICEVLEVMPKYFYSEKKQFENYFDIKSKSLERKIIESIYLLAKSGILTLEENDYSGQLQAVVEPWNNNVLRQMVNECFRYADSIIDDVNHDIINKIVNKYEEKLHESFLNNDDVELPF